MPPKKATKVEEEIVDESSLPPWLPFQVLVIYHKFITQEKREEFNDILQGEQKFSVIDRECIEFYAEEYGLTEPNVEVSNTQWGKIWSKKVYFLNIHGRRTKRDDLAHEASRKPSAVEGEEEEAENVEEPEPVKTEYNPDCCYLFKDCPNSFEEFASMVDNGIVFNMVLYIKPDEEAVQQQNDEIKAQYEQAVKENQEKEEAGEAVEEIPEPDEPPPTFPEEFVKIQDYTRKVPKDSPWRNCIFKIMDYKKYEEEPVEEGEEPEEDTRDIFYTDLYEELVYLGKQYAEYVDWMAKTTVVPLWGKLEEVWPEGYVPPVPTPSNG